MEVLKKIGVEMIEFSFFTEITPGGFKPEERLIFEFTNEGDTVLDPFGGLMTVPVLALRNNRKAIGIELNSDYYKDGLFYVRCESEKINMPSLFDILEETQI